jgi:hypothetical protein
MDRMAMFPAWRTSGSSLNDEWYAWARQEIKPRQELKKDILA